VLGYSVVKLVYAFKGGRGNGEEKEKRKGGRTKEEKINGDEKTVQKVSCPN